MVQSSPAPSEGPEPKGGRPRKGKAATPPAASEEESQTAALGARAVELSEFYQGKVELIPKVPIRTLSDFSLYYTPGIAQVSRAIAAAPD
ncbi:MAG: hypothetical protein L3K08_08635, partial [Thermoplasmata archaeon]|nr:hypothetical protein [Thermoplasmata archaeon]